MTDTDSDSNTDRVIADCTAVSLIYWQSEWVSEWNQTNTNRPVGDFVLVLL